MLLQLERAPGFLSPVTSEVVKNLNEGTSKESDAHLLWELIMEGEGALRVG